MYQESAEQQVVKKLNGTNVSLNEYLSKKTSEVERQGSEKDSEHSSNMDGKVFIKVNVTRRGQSLMYVGSAGL